MHPRLIEIPSLHLTLWSLDITAVGLMLGLAFSLAFILYGIARFLLESVRDDNPFEVVGLTISQIMGLALVILGVGLLAVILTVKRDSPELSEMRLEPHRGGLTQQP